MRFDNIITQTQTQSGSLSCRFGCKEWLKNFVQDFLRNTWSIITNLNDNVSISLFCGYHYNRIKCSIQFLLLFIYGVKSIIEKIQQNSSHILRHNIYLSNRCVKI